MTSNIAVFYVLIIVCVILIILLNYLLKRKNKKQLDISFSILVGMLTFWVFCCILQIYCVNKFNTNPMYFDYLTYSVGFFIPVILLFTSLIYAKTKIIFRKRYLIYFLIPIISVILVWTNEWHHLFLEQYSTIIAENKIGPWFNVHSAYTFILDVGSLLILIVYSIKNSGFFSKPATLIFIGAGLPIVVNALGSVGVIKMSIYTTPISLAVSAICLSFAFFRFNILKNTPIALQTIADRISDSYVILNNDYEVTDFNETFVKTFKIKDAGILRGKHFAVFLNELGLRDMIPEFGKYLEKVDSTKKVARLEADIKKIHKNFSIEITSIFSNNQFLGILVLFKDITQHIQDMQSLKDSQDLLVEQERLASLGQMIGGIAHNLKTPIFSVAGGLEGLSDLIKEYDESIDDPNVNSQDMHDIARDMNEWISKLKDHVAYMSDVITTVKGQAVNMSEEQHILFPISELFQHVNILMQHEIKEKLAELEVKNKVPDVVRIDGNINSLVQVVNNLISNAIEAYGDNPVKKVELSADFNNKEVIISVKDYGPGLPDEVQKKLFKEMITTKGKDGTGLGLFMSYSNIKAHFNGTMTYETSSKGTIFNIIIPIK